MRKPGRVKVAVSLALALGLLAYFLAQANLKDVALRIGRVSPWVFLLSLACSISSIFIRTVRWQLLLRPAGPVGFGPAFTATTVGFAASTVLPARAGEVVRPVVLSRRTPVRLSASLASVLFERVIDLATVLILFLVYCWTPGLRPVMRPEAAGVFASLRAFALVCGAGAAVFFVVAILATGHRARAERGLERLARRLPERFRGRVVPAFSSFLDGMHAVRQPGTIVAVAALSLLLWSLICGQVYFLFRAFALPLDPAASILIVVVTLIGLAIPTPGGVGGFHKLCQVALTMFYGVDVDAATGLAIVYWFVAFAPVTLLGFALFAAGSRHSRSSLSDLAEAAAEE